MGWVLNGEWDAATYPDGGMTGVHFPTAMAQICKGINDRIAAAGGTLLSWKYTDALDVETEYPTAEQIAGAVFGQRCFQEFFAQAHSWIQDNDDADTWYSSSDFAEAVTVSDLWESANAGVPAANIDKGPLWAPNWVRIKNVLDRMLYVVSPNITIAQLAETTSSSSHIPLGTYQIEDEDELPEPLTRTPEAAWADMTDADPSGSFNTWNFFAASAFATASVITNSIYYRVLNNTFYDYPVAGIWRKVIVPQIVRKHSGVKGQPLGVMFHGTSDWDEPMIAVSVNGVSPSGTPRRALHAGTDYVISVAFPEVAPYLNDPGVAFVPSQVFENAIFRQAYAANASIHCKGIMLDMSSALDDQL